MRRRGLFEFFQNRNGQINPGAIALSHIVGRELFWFRRADAILDHANQLAQRIQNATVSIQSAGDAAKLSLAHMAVMQN